MYLDKQTILILLVWTGVHTAGWAQAPQKALTSLENRHLLAKIDNPIRIVAQQNDPVSIQQLDATFQPFNAEKAPIEIREGKGYFIIRPDTTGLVEIRITVGDTVEIKTLPVKPLEAVGYLGRIKANSDEKMAAGEFKAQMGISAVIECCGFDARCQVLGFKVMRISAEGQTERAVNPEARFRKPAIDMIQKAKPGDLYIFRQIKYQCPGSGQPQRLEDMIVEIE